MAKLKLLTSFFNFQFFEILIKFFDIFLGMHSTRVYDEEIWRSKDSDVPGLSFTHALCLHQNISKKSKYNFIAVLCTFMSVRQNLIFNSFMCTLKY